jgi:hypothetical protein
MRIAPWLTAEGWRSARTGGDLTDRMVQALIRKHGLCYRRRLRIADVVARQPGEETVLEAANRVGIPRGTLLCWLRQGKLRGRLTNVAARRIWLVQVSDVDLTLAGRTQPLMPDTPTDISPTI